MAATRRIRDLAFVVLWLSGASLEAQSRMTQTDQGRLDSLLLDQATRLLERYGDTFYVLGLHIAPDGKVEGISTRHWAAFSAPPDEWLDSLQVAFQDYLPRLRAASYVVDCWRQLDSLRADSTYVVFTSRPSRATASRRGVATTGMRADW